MTVKQAIRHLTSTGFRVSANYHITNPDDFTDYTPGEDKACLDGHFTAKQLFAIAVIMVHQESRNA